MNLLRRLARRFRTVRAAIRGLESAPLPPTVVDPTVPAATLTARAEASGTAAARALMYDGWSFGRPADPESDRFDPSFVRQLRHECRAAVASIQARQSITSSRVSHVTRWRNESESMMDSARRRMSGIAAREARLDATRIRESQSRAGMDVTAEVPAVEVPDESAWEGETRALGTWWRVLILLGLVAAELPVQFVVYDYFLGGSSSWTGLAGLLSLSTATGMVLGPFVAGLLVRARQTTGGPGYIGPLVLALAVPWAYVAVILGVLQGRRFDLGDGGGSRLERLNLTPVTVVVMFVALLFVVGAMGYLLGLARNHPFQQAYVRSRRRRDRMDALRREMADRINAAYREPDTQSPNNTEPDERAVIEAYGAAEEAYFDALTRTVGDPTFTEAVERRRGSRPVPAPQASEQVPANPPAELDWREGAPAETDPPAGRPPEEPFRSSQAVDDDGDAEPPDGRGPDAGGDDGRDRDGGQPPDPAGPNPEPEGDPTLADDDPDSPEPTIVDRPMSWR